jgi:hypothetical protein
VTKTAKSKERMESSKKRSDGRDSKKGYRDTEDIRLLHGQISCIKIFECKLCKTEQIMMEQYIGRFVYLRNSGKVAKYGIGKLLIACLEIRSYV